MELNHRLTPRQGVALPLSYAPVRNKYKFIRSLTELQTRMQQTNNDYHSIEKISYFSKNNSDKVRYIFSFLLKIHTMPILIISDQDSAKKSVFYAAVYFQDLESVQFLIEKGKKALHTGETLYTNNDDKQSACVLAASEIVKSSKEDIKKIYFQCLGEIIWDGVKMNDEDLNLDASQEAIKIIETIIKIKEDAIKEYIRLNHGFKKEGLTSSSPQIKRLPIPQELINMFLAPKGIFDYEVARMITNTSSHTFSR